MAATASEGAKFCILPGVHRMQAINPKKNQQFYGQNAPVLNGSRLITSFSRDGNLWVASNQTQQGERRIEDECLTPRCSYPEAFFINNTPLLAVNSKTAVTSGKFFFDYDADKIYFSDDPTGKTVEASVSPYAFRGNISGVVVQGLVVEKYSSSIQYSAIGYNGGATGWIVQNNEVRLNYAVGVGVGSNSIVVGNNIHHNGEMGVGCNGANILFDGNEISYNGFFSGLDPLWEGGGGKCAITTNLIVRNNYSHHNNAMGFWTDIDNVGTLYENNRIEYNLNGGISHEISYAAVIRNNTFKGNGYGFESWLWGGAIQIQNSRDVEVYGNHIEVTPEGGNGICLVQQDRGSGILGLHATANNFIHDNVIVSMTPDHGISGAIADYDPAGMKAANNRFSSNHYYVSNINDEHWAWVDDFYGWNTYRSTAQQDQNSTVGTVAPF